MNMQQSNQKDSQPVLSYASPVPRNRDATLSLILGLLLFVPFVTGALAIRYGRRGQRDAIDLNGRGRELARMGIFLGWINLVLSTLFAITLPFAVMRAREAAMRNQCMSQMRQIGLGVFVYASQNNGYLPQSLDQLG